YLALAGNKKSPCIKWALSLMPRLICPTFWGQYKCGHINMQGRYSFTVPESVSKGELRAFNEER
ncbi:hypothetical protein, partial [Klebsiella pneumoniae]|uniref:hypothetical protein n=1 Tax=Klebsiella pneumoniae TaxID=573 RepID=UPI003B5C0945